MYIVNGIAYAGELEENILDNLYSLQELGIYEQHMVKIQGIMGANYAPTNYYLEGHTQELDKDGG